MYSTIFLAAMTSLHVRTVFDQLMGYFCVPCAYVLVSEELSRAVDRSSIFGTWGNGQQRCRRCRSPFVDDTQPTNKRLIELCCRSRASLGVVTLPIWTWCSWLKAMFMQAQMLAIFQVCHAFLLQQTTLLASTRLLLVINVLPIKSKTFLQTVSMYVRKDHYTKEVNREEGRLIKRSFPMQMTGTSFSRYSKHMEMNLML